MKLTQQMLERLEQLQEKYAAMGQDMNSYLDGLLHADYLTYWDYIHLDTLLSLQNPRTSFPDERIFIVYHQITELYFKLCINAIEQLVVEEDPPLDLFKRQVKRCTRYFEALIHSFEIMVEGMDKEEFLKFRMSLLPASGFQSAQYRMIELMSTDLIQLVHPNKREQVHEHTPVEKIYQWMYWKSGATELATGKKTLTLKQFENKYAHQFIRLAKRMEDVNIRRCYYRLPEQDQSDPELIELMRNFDHQVNVLWPLQHYKSAVRYLDNKPNVIKATGGTNWQKYLPPRMQQISFYPELWSEDEINNWGRSGKPASKSSD